MPGKNIVKQFQSESYYHIYNRGINRQDIFVDYEDCAYFERILERTIGPKQLDDSKGRSYTWLRERVLINAYCLMPNHFHLLAYQMDEKGMSQLMQTIGVAYTGYFNKKYKRRGPLFENLYRAVLITHDEQLLHITRYIHLNHHDYKNWQHSSYSDYLSGTGRAWIESRPILELFDSISDYQKFVQDYEALQREHDILKKQLADNI